MKKFFKKISLIAGVALCLLNICMPLAKANTPEEKAFLSELYRMDIDKLENELAHNPKLAGVRWRTPDGILQDNILHIAYINNRWDIIEYVLKNCLKYVDLNAKNYNNDTFFDIIVNEYMKSKLNRDHCKAKVADHQKQVVDYQKQVADYKERVGYYLNCAFKYYSSETSYQEQAARYKFVTTSYQEQATNCKNQAVNLQNEASICRKEVDNCQEQAVKYKSSADQWREKENEANEKCEKCKYYFEFIFKLFYRNDNICMDFKYNELKSTRFHDGTSIIEYFIRAAGR